jgi:hypothetical protein
MDAAQRGSPRPTPPTRPPAMVLVIGRPEQWPESIVRLANRSIIELTCVMSIYEAAACLTLRRGKIAGVLVDPQGLSRREWEMLEVLRKHIPQPVWSLPVRAGRDKEIARGLLPWEAAESALEQLPVVSTPQESQGSNRFSGPGDIYTKADIVPPSEFPQSAPPKSAPMAKTSHNEPLKTPKKDSEIPVVSEVAPSYDERGIEPLLSENEIRALLGP